MTARSNPSVPYGARFTGVYFDARTPSVKIYNRGTLVETISANDVTFADKIVATSPATITGNTNTYVEGTITGLLTALENLGLITDSTT